MRNSGLTRGLTQPWTHHDIIRLVAPFTEHGRQLDLEASSRTERRLVFRPRLHANVFGGMSITEHLVLENPSRGTYRVVRDAILPDGLLSRLIAQGPEPGGVLAAIEHVPVARGIHSGNGFVVASSHVIESFGWTPSHGAGEPTLVFKRAVAKAAGLSLTVVVSDVRGYPATAEIAAPAGETIDLPHDFLSVAGAEWRPLERVKAGWRTTLSIRGREPRLSERVEASVERAAAHMAQTIVEPPQRFHARCMWARWMAELRRAGPLLFWIAVCLAAMRLSSVPQSPLAAGILLTPLVSFVLFGSRFFEWSKIGLVAHEVLHIALRHSQRYVELRGVLGDADLQLFNICADAIVNSALAGSSWLELPPSSVFMDQLLRDALGIEITADKALAEWDVERIYRAIDDRREGQQGSSKQGQERASTGQSAGSQPRESQSEGRERLERRDEDDGAGSRPDGERSARARRLGARIHRDLIVDPGPMGATENEADRSQAWIERIARAHAGDGQFSLLRGLIADLPRSRTPWEHILRTRLSRALAPKPSTSWSRPTRSYIANQGRCGPSWRVPWEPGRFQPSAVPRIALMVDVSGSIDKRPIGQFSRQIEAISRRQEAGLVLIIGDDRVRRTEVFEAGRVKLAGIAFEGGGDTDFTPLLEAADRHRPDIGVVLTDLGGPARFRPRWPVIWAVPAACAASVPPFGTRLVLA